MAIIHFATEILMHFVAALVFVEDVIEYVIRICYYINTPSPQFQFLKHG